jgi:hypothetical protein
MRQHLKPETVKELETMFDLRREAIQILDLVVAEWKSDPMSVQCFDLRTVERAKVVMDGLNKLKHHWDI